MGYGGYILEHGLLHVANGLLRMARFYMDGAGCCVLESMVAKLSGKKSALVHLQSEYCAYFKGWYMDVVRSDTCRSKCLICGLVTRLSWSSPEWVTE